MHGPRRMRASPGLLPFGYQAVTQGPQIPSVRSESRKSRGQADRKFKRANS